MGIYAQTSITINCKNNKTAKAVAEKIKKLDKANNNDLNYGYENLSVEYNYVYLDKSSGRIQNLEYQCEVLWNLVKKVKGVVELNAPFLAEADGMYFSKKK